MFGAFVFNAQEPDTLLNDTLLEFERDADGNLERVRDQDVEVVSPLSEFVDTTDLSGLVDAIG